MDYNNKKGALLILSVALLVFVLIVVSKIGKDQVEPELVVDTPNLGVETNDLLYSGDYEDIISIHEKEGITNLDREKKLELIYSYLNYGNYFYKEEENSKKAMEVLNTMEEDYSNLYYKGFAQEIIKNYTGALEYYNKGLTVDIITTEQKSALFNQIGHLYDLTGQIEEAFSYYKKAHLLDKNDGKSLANLGRYYIRIGKSDKAYEYMNKALENTKSLPAKAELSFGLSSLELEMNGLKPDVDKSMEYAKKAIDYYSNYPMGYFALAKGLYMKNDNSLNSEIERNLIKAFELNPNSTHVYELSALHEYGKGNYDTSKEYFDKVLDVMPNDMILMEDERILSMDNIRYMRVTYLYYLLFEKINNYRVDEDMNGLNNFLNQELNKEGNKVFLKNFLLSQFKRKNYGFLNSLLSEEEIDDLIIKITN